MTGGLAIELDWEKLERGSPEERATYALLGVRWGDLWLTQVQDAFVGRLRDKAPLSAYRLAEWMAWNWHRLRWEPQPRTPTLSWASAHEMSSIGGGYVWPNITIFSDGERIVWLAKPTEKRPQEPLQYIADVAAVVRAGMFESAVDQFIEQVLGQLAAEGIRQTNLANVWAEVRAERADPKATSRRRFEALLGFDPDDGDQSLIDTLISDAVALGETSMNEVAASRLKSGSVVTADDLRRLAARGAVAHLDDAVTLKDKTGLPLVGQSPAWHRGAVAAKRLREQERLGDGRIDNAVLAGMFGAPTSTVSQHSDDVDLSFALSEGGGPAKVVLRARRETGRRFELARLIGDRVAAATDNRLLPATPAYTYRQKLQRSFAAELLCPFEALDDMLAGDLSDEAIEEAAAEFNVSEKTVLTLLVNNRRLPREDLDQDFDTAA